MLSSRGRSACGLQPPNTFPTISFCDRMTSTSTTSAFRTEGGATEVRQARPPLRVSSISGISMSPLIRLAVMIVLSAITPRVSSVTSGIASSIEATACVAPSSFACSRRYSNGSTATMTSAPAIRAPCTALEPTPPVPTTTTVSPGPTWGPIDRGAEAGGDPAADQRRQLQWDVVVDLMQESSCTTVYGANVPSRDS